MYILLILLLNNLHVNAQQEVFVKIISNNSDINEKDIQNNLKVNDSIIAIEYLKSTLSLIQSKGFIKASFDSTKFENDIALWECLSLFWEEDPIILSHRKFCNIFYMGPSGKKNEKRK